MLLKEEQGSKHHIQARNLLSLSAQYLNQAIMLDLVSTLSFVLLKLWQGIHETLSEEEEYDRFALQATTNTEGNNSEKAKILDEVPYNHQIRHENQYIGRYHISIQQDSPITC